jgi:hypothetical protein
LAGIIDDDCSPGSSDLKRREKTRERIESDVDAEQVETPVRVAILRRCRDPGDALAEKDIDAGPEQVVVCERADIPGAGMRIGSIRRIFVASALVAGGIEMDPSDAAWPGRVLYELNVNAAVAASANQDEIPILVAEVEIGGLRDLSEQAAAERLDQRQPVAKRPVAQRVAKDADRAGSGFEII